MQEAEGCLFEPPQIYQSLEPLANTPDRQVFAFPIREGFW